VLFLQLGQLGLFRVSFVDVRLLNLTQIGVVFRYILNLFVFDLNFFLELLYGFLGMADFPLEIGVFLEELKHVRVHADLVVRLLVVLN
jgi:hypothetical protein